MEGVGVIERTFAMIKPDALARGLAEEVIKRIESSGLKVVAQKRIKPTPEFVEEFYPSTDEWFKSIGDRAKIQYQKQGLSIKKYYGTEDSIEMGKVVKKWLVDYIASDPVVAMIVEGENAVKRLRELAGATDPSIATKGTIRGDLSDDSTIKANNEGRSIQNVIHVSGDVNEAEREIKLWFPELKK